MKSTRNYSADTGKIQEWLDHSEGILIGAGAGLTASGGIYYGNEELTAEWFPEYTKLGLKTISEIMGIYWNVTPQNAPGYYAFWAKHIRNVRYKPEVLKPYADLRNIIGTKDYFILTTNVDRQFTKAGFDDNKTLATQGDYGLFQCSVPCTQEVYDNREMVEQMVKNRVDAYSIREQDIPRCPHCGNFLIPNLRKDNTFVEEPHLRNLHPYYNYLDRVKNEHITLLELGVGFNTPGIIRFPFERLAQQYPDNVKLIRINMDNASVPANIRYHSISVKGDIASVLETISYKKQI